MHLFFHSVFSVQDGDGRKEDIHVSVVMVTTQVRVWMKTTLSIHSTDPLWKARGDLKTKEKGADNFFVIKHLVSEVFLARQNKDAWDQLQDFLVVSILILSFDGCSTAHPLKSCH